MTPGSIKESREPRISIGIFAWNEERAIANTLRSLFRQTLFGRLSQLGGFCEVICVTNGCTDRTAEVAAQVLAEQTRDHPWPGCFQGRVARIEERGKVNAWNQYVHALSSPCSRYLFMMDADILIHQSETLWNMIGALERDPEAAIAVDRPCKDVSFKARKSVRDYLSIAVSRMTTGAEAQLCGQLYCIRSQVARSIYLPKDLSACEDGILKCLVCTDNLAHEVWPQRIRVAEQAEHTFEAYVSPRAILKNHKRQIIGQTMVHILVDRELPALRQSSGEGLAQTLRERDNTDPNWFKRRVSQHLQQTGWFWRLHPGLLTQRFRHLRRCRPWKRVLYLPAAVAATGATLVSSFLAYRSLKAGCIAYWPKADRAGFGPMKGTAAGGA